VENFAHLLGAPEAAKPPLGPRDVRKNISKLLRKRREYPTYFSKNLGLIDLKLKKVLVRASISVVRPKPVFGDYERSTGTCGLMFVEPARVKIEGKVLKECNRKEKEILKKYAIKVKAQREKEIQKEKDRKFIKEGMRWQRRRAARLEREFVQQPLETLRAGARAAGVEDVPIVREHLGAQVRPPAELQRDIWIKDPEVVTAGEIRQAMKDLNVSSISVATRPMLAGPANASRGPRESFCASCPYRGDGEPGECPNCGARLNVFSRSSRAKKPRKSRGSGRQMPR